MSTPDFQRARRHLSRRDPVLKALIKKVGPCTLLFNEDHFSVLARSIVSQQISTKAAKAISSRLELVLGKRGFQPKAVVEASEDDLRTAGLSENKRRSLRDLAEKCLSKEVPLKKLRDLSDEEVIETLTPVRGIGRWTAEMFLIFSLGRLNVLPVGDYGLRAGVKRLYDLPEIPKPGEVKTVGEKWTPYCSIATWYVWRSLGDVPQSKEE